MKKELGEFDRTGSKEDKQWKTEEQDKEKRAEKEEGEKKGEKGKIRGKDKGANVIWTQINSRYHGVVVCEGLECVGVLVCGGCSLWWSQSIVVA